MNEIQASPAMYPNHSDNPHNKDVGEEQQAEPRIVITACMDEFPALSCGGGDESSSQNGMKPAVSLDNSAHDDTDDEWENLFSDGDNNSIDKDSSQTKAQPIISNSDTFHRCMSTPEFSKLQREDDSYVLDCTMSSVDAFSVTGSDAVLITKRNDGSKGGMKKVPSFKDIIMLNAQAREEEDRKQKEKLQEQQERLRKEAMERRKKSRPRLVVNPIKRCAKSTGDLRSMVIVEEEEEGYYGGGGGGIIQEDEVLGDTDASEFYSRKQKGSTSRQNGKKLRPDEAKRKNFIIHKKEAQRRAQQQR
eukprot:CAMPEP_0204618236 /NCGR_PEP_ID=MMETSP0717-20131115/4957_1 /ASSEMBLY_ACC=CAM_ASM_000666 /TAXON_ID=230516 /ORGANISM="Chaetoceros curvisetus" /LENGTH=303 /DNA_ID=CAMNT_0051631935 /DNA_START=14 /DNA_END=925 /DNA_ORIENTATION=-